MTRHFLTGQCLPLLHPCRFPLHLQCKHYFITPSPTVQALLHYSKSYRASITSLLQVLPCKHYFITPSPTVQALLHYSKSYRASITSLLQVLQCKHYFITPSPTVQALLHYSKSYMQALLHYSKSYSASSTSSKPRSATESAEFIPPVISDLECYREAARAGLTTE